MKHITRGVIIVVLGIGMLSTSGWARKGKVKLMMQVPPFNAEDFVDENGDPFPIDNSYWPLVPGTTFVYEAQTDDEIERNEVYVSHNTKEIMGVTCVVVEDSAWEGDLLTEFTKDWYAQDMIGNIWYLGEYSEQYEYDDNGNLILTTTEGSWEAGVNGAEPGIIMPANPRPGQSYRQEYYEDVAEDMAKVLRLNVSASVAYGDFENCLQTKEWSSLEPGIVEHKFYAPGVGLVMIKELKDQKRVELIDILTE